MALAAGACVSIRRLLQSTGNTLSSWSQNICWGSVVDRSLKKFHCELQHFSPHEPFRQWAPSRALHVRILTLQNIVDIEERILPPRGDYVPPLEPRPIQRSSKRCGVLALKVGCFCDWDEWGALKRFTILWIDDCQVTQVKIKEFDGTTGLQVGGGWEPDHKIHPLLLGHYRKQKVPAKRKLAEFKVSRDALLPTGTSLGAAHFIAGQQIDVTGVTIGYGFQGGMKRWGFGGGPATHGSNFHRKPGSIGQRGMRKIVRGKRMAGQTGGNIYTAEDRFLWKVDPVRNLLYVEGPIPGNAGEFVLVRDSTTNDWEMRQQFPFPTYLDMNLPPVMQAKFKRDAFSVFRPDVR